MKKFLCSLVFLIILSSFVSLNTFAHAKPEQISINDFSGVISDTVKEYITAKNDILFEKTEAKIIFVTTDGTENLYINEYAQKLYSDWDVDYMGKKNSILIVIDTQSGEYGFARGKGIRYALPDSEIYRYMINYFEPHYSAGSNDKAVMSLYNAIARWYEGQYNGLSLSLDDNIDSYMYGIREKEVDIKESKLWVWVSLVVCIIILFVVLKIKRDYKLRMRKNERRKHKKKQQVDIDKIVRT